MLAGSYPSKLSRVVLAANVHVGVGAVTLRASGARRDRGRALRTARHLVESTQRCSQPGILAESSAFRATSSNERQRGDRNESTQTSECRPRRIGAFGLRFGTAVHRGRTAAGDTDGAAPRAIRVRLSVGDRASPLEGNDDAAAAIHPLRASRSRRIHGRRGRLRAASHLSRRLYLRRRLPRRGRTSELTIHTRFSP